MKAELVTTPTEPWLNDAISRCELKFTAISPFVGDIFPDIISRLRPGVACELLTVVNIRNFAVGASSLDALSKAAQNGVVVKSVTRLHAKVYIIDSAIALVTSANATGAGLQRNRECGVALKDPVLISDLHALASSGFDCDEGPVSWSAEELESISESVSVVRRWLPAIYNAQRPARVMEENLELPGESEKNELIASFQGWTSLVLEGVMAQANNMFSLDGLYSTCAPLARVRYPNNQHVRAKLRQQLQRLRDLGLVEFETRGVYRRLIEVRNK